MLGGGAEVSGQFGLAAPAGRGGPASRRPGLFPRGGLLGSVQPPALPGPDPCPVMGGSEATAQLSERGRSQPYRSPAA